MKSISLIYNNDLLEVHEQIYDKKLEDFEKTPQGND